MRKVRSTLIRSLIIGLLPTVLWAGPVNINTADAGKLAEELDGVGLERAADLLGLSDSQREALSPIVTRYLDGEQVELLANHIERRTIDSLGIRRILGRGIDAVILNHDLVDWQLVTQL